MKAYRLIGNINVKNQTDSLNDRSKVSSVTLFYRHSLVIGDLRYNTSVPQFESDGQITSLRSYY